jgi:hypothetical protein
METGYQKPDLERQTPSPASFAWRTWFRFQRFVERISPNPVAWWPFDPPDPEYDGNEPTTGQVQVSAGATTIPTSATGVTTSSSLPVELVSVRPSSFGSDGVSSVAPGSTAIGSDRASTRIRPSAEQQPTNKSGTYILLCFDVSKLKMRGGFRHECRLRQIETTAAISDREVFDAMRREYYGICSSFKRYLSMRALAQINFIKVQNVCSVLWMKPSDSNTSFTYTIATMWISQLSQKSCRPRAMPITRSTSWITNAHVHEAANSLWNAFIPANRVQTAASSNLFPKGGDAFRMPEHMGQSGDYILWRV